MKWARAWLCQGTACFKMRHSMRSREELGKGQMFGYNYSDKPFEGLSGRKWDKYIFLKVTLAVLWRWDWGKRRQSRVTQDVITKVQTQDDDLHLLQYRWHERREAVMELRHTSALNFQKLLLDVRGVGKNDI